MEPTVDSTNSTPSPLVEVAAPVDHTRPRWKVGVFSIMCDLSTVYADTPNEAVETIAKGLGLPAGVEGPTMIGTAVIPFDSPHAKDFIGQWMAQIHHNQQAEPQPQIIVPKIIKPKGL